MLLLDCDRDGDLDVWFRQGGKLASRGVAPEETETDRLFRNLFQERGSLQFEDITGSSGIQQPAYGMGGAVGDFDRDGHLDVYLTNFGRDRLLFGLGNCRFEDRTEASGVREERWTTAAAAFDADGDGWLDLYVGAYVDYEVGKGPECRRADGSPDYCSPKVYPALPDRLWRNLGNGRFEEAAEKLGFRANEAGRALGLAVFDADADGDLDLFVANDSNENFLFLQVEPGAYREEGLLRGVAVNALGQRTGDMGVEAEDFDGDGDFDLFVTHFPEEGAGFWSNDGQGFFWDRAAASKVLAATQGTTGFGTAALDPDRDGWLDLVVANGAIQFRERTPSRAGLSPLAEPNLWIVNLGRGRFEDHTAQAGPFFSILETNRSIARGDLDQDGDLDWILTAMDGSPHLLLSRGKESAPWIGFELVDRTGGIPHGASVEVRCDSGRVLLRRVAVEASYLAANDPRVLFGLEGCTLSPEVEVSWPGRSRERFGPFAPGTYHRLSEGTGTRSSGAQP